MSVTADTAAGEVADRALRHRIEAAWASLLDGSDAIADRISRALLEHDEEWYDAAGPVVRAELYSAIREHVRRGIRTMAGLTARGQEPVHVWREHARQRARQGAPLEMVLNGYSIGTRMLWEALLERARDGRLEVDDRTLLKAGQKLWANVDVQNSAVVEAYRHESALLQRRDLERQGRVLDGLVDGRGSDPGFAAEAHEVLGVLVDEPVACVAAPFDGCVDNPLRSPEDRLTQLGLVSHWHARGDVYFGLVRLGTGSTADLVQPLADCSTGRVGIAPAAEGLAGFSTAYQLALGAAETMPRAQPAVVTVESRLPEVLLSAAPAASALLVREVLGPVLAQSPAHADTLVATLRALLAHDLSPTHAAEALFCHRNTVIYRQRQICDLTGRDLSDARDRMLLGLALLALDL